MTKFIFLYTLIIIFNRVKKIKNLQFYIYLYMLIYFYGYNSLHINADTVVNFIAGVLMSPIFINISMYLSYKVFVSGEIKGSVSKISLIIEAFMATLEELIWRSLFFNILFTLHEKPTILIIIINSFLFTLAHNNIEDIYGMIESI